jgi:hypothetical protein
LLENFDLVQLQIEKEVSLGRYIISKTCPSVVSSLGAVPKSPGAIRLIHDMSRPDGGINVYGVDSAVHYSTIDDALKLVVPGTYMAKVDLSEAYRSIPTHPSCHRLTGLHWTFAGCTEPTFLYDVRLPFGNSLSCKMFQSLSDSIVRMFNKSGFFAISYIDDFLVVSDSESKCKLALDCLVNLIEKLGLVINWKKVTQPAQRVVFLGVDIDCCNRTLSLPSKKLAEVKSLLTKWYSKRKCTKRELQCLIGSLNWCARVIRGGRTFCRNLINLLCKVDCALHYIRLSAAARSDIAWWVVALDKFNGSCPFNIDIPTASFEFSTDACLEGGAGSFKTDWFHTNWSTDHPEVVDKDINFLELYTILLAVRRWGSYMERPSCTCACQ